MMRRLEAAERDVAVAGAAEIDRAAVRQVRDAVDVHRRMPVELVERRAKLQASAMQAWIDARARDDLRRSSRCWRRPRCWRGRRSASSRRRRRGRRRATCWPATLFDATRMNNLEAIDLGRNGDHNNAVTLTLAGVLSSTSGGTGISAGGDDIELFIFVDDQGETRDDDTLSGGWTVNGTVTTIAVIGSETTFNLYVASGIQVALQQGWIDS